jgi:peptide/nickel transport system ATP-binding protein
MKPGGALLEAEGLIRRYAMRRGFFGHAVEVRAVDGVSLKLERGRTLGLVGESGCGKSTTGRLVLGMEMPDAGRVSFEGATMPQPGSTAWRKLRARMQMVFQDPLGALDRRLPIATQIAEPLDIHAIGAASERAARVEALLRAVGLRPDQGARYPHELSGGQRQRIAIARALILKPRVLVLDEPTNGLDPQQIAEMRDVLKRYAKTGRTVIISSHLLAEVQQTCSHVVLMHRGQLIAFGTMKKILNRNRKSETLEEIFLELIGDDLVIGKEKQ